jgi:Mg/Co/Ni transporter MgtE
MNEQLILCRSHIQRHPAHAARILQRLTINDAAALLLELEEPHAVMLARHAAPGFVARVLQRLALDRAARLVHRLGVHTGVTILRQLGKDSRTKILQQLPAATSLIYQVLLSYPEDAVGAWIDNQAVALSDTDSVAEALRHLGEAPDDLAAQVYVLSEAQRLVGIATVPWLLRSEEKTALSEISQPVTDCLFARASLNAVKDHAGWQQNHVLPVVDNADRFLGVLHYARVASPTQVMSEAFAGTMLSDFMETLWMTGSSMFQGAVGAVLPSGEPEQQEPQR